MTETEYQYTPLRIWDLSRASQGKTQNLDTPDRRVDGGLARSLAQPRGTLAVRLRFGVRGRAAGLRPQGSEASAHRGHYVSPAPAALHEHGFGNNARTTAGRAHAVSIRARSASTCATAMAYRALRHAERALALIWTGSTAGTAATYGVPNISSVQDYDHGPTGAPISMAPSAGSSVGQ